MAAQSNTGNEVKMVTYRIEAHTQKQIACDRRATSEIKRNPFHGRIFKLRKPRASTFKSSLHINKMTNHV